jgi:hypothetical protein
VFFPSTVGTIVMKLKIKKFMRHLLHNDDANMSVFSNWQLAEELFWKSKQLPWALRNWVIKKIFPGHGSALNQGEALKQDEARAGATALPIREVAKKTR